MRILFLLQYLVFGLLTFGQSKINIDSLKRVILVSRFENDGLEIGALKKVAKYYENENLDSTIKYAKILEELGKEQKNAGAIFNASLFQNSHYYYSGNIRKYLQEVKKSYEVILPLNDFKVEITALGKLSELYRMLSEEDSAKHFNNLLLKLSHRENYDLGKVIGYQNMASYFYKNQVLDSALFYSFKSETICNSLQETSSYCASSTKLIARIHVHKKENKKAISKYKIAQKLFYQAGNIRAVYTTNTRLANVYIREKEYEIAGNKLDSSFAYFKSKGYYPGLVTCLFEMINLAFQKKEYRKAIQFCKDLEKLNLENGVQLNRSLNKDFGKAYFLSKDYNKSIFYLEKAYEEAIAKKSIAKQENALYYLSRAYSKSGAYKKANSYYELYTKANEKKVKLKNSKYTSELTAKYETEKKDQEIKLLKANEIINQQKRKRKTNLLVIVTIVSLLIGLFLFVLYRNRLETTRKLKEIDKMKTNFFENISHEFRTPLTLIKLPLKQAINNQKDLDSQDLNLMYNNANRLQNLIEDLLSLSELEVGKIKIKKSEQDPLLQSKILSSQFDSYAESKGVAYQKVIEHNAITATYDKSVVEKVLSNLISNAIKYSEVGKEVQVSVAVVDQKLVIKVSDNGAGISSENQKRIFDRFYQVEDKDEGKQGSGIGLALVKKLLEIHGGTIEVTSKINEGSTFTATLPLENFIQLSFDSKPIEIKKKSTILPKKEDLLEITKLSNKPHLLIAEDSKELLEYISTLFKEDFQIIQANDGVDGMQRALEQVPDFIISDWMMPNKNGLEFCKDIKSNSVTSHIPFLLLTAKSMVEDKIEGYETGADAYFSKPFNFNELKSRISSLLKQRQLLYDKFSNSESQPINPATNSMDVKFWQEFKQYLKDNISDSELNATQIAKHLGMSRMQLHRKLTALTGQNLSSFIKNQRMNKAADLLKDPANRVSDICFNIGYEDQSAFSRAFKKEFGVSPTKYRENLP